MDNNAKLADLSHNTGMDRLDGDLLPGQVQSEGERWQGGQEAGGMARISFKMTRKN